MCQGDTDLTVGEFPVKMIACLSLVTQKRGEGVKILQLYSSVHGEPLGEHVLGVETAHPPAVTSHLSALSSPSKTDPSQGCLGLKALYGNSTARHKASMYGMP